MQRVEKVVTLIKLAITLTLIPLRLMLGVLGFLVDNWRLLAVILSSVVFAALVANAAAVWAAVAANVALGVASARAAVVAAAAWVYANAPLILLTALFIGIILLMDDVAAALRGDNSAMKEWLGNWKDDNPGDPWWLRDLKSLAYLMLNFGPIFDFWKGEFTKLWKWIADSAADTWGDIVHGIKKLFGVSDPDWDKAHRDKSRLAFGYTKDMSATLGGGEWKSNSQGEKLWYPFNDIEQDAGGYEAARRDRYTAAPVHVVQNIHPQPNATAEEIAGYSIDKLQSTLDDANAEM